MIEADPVSETCLKRLKMMDNIQNNSNVSLRIISQFRLSTLSERNALSTDTPIRTLPPKTQASGHCRVENQMTN
jgi:hypothetical protein